MGSSSISHRSSNTTKREVEGFSIRFKTVLRFTIVRRRQKCRRQSTVCILRPNILREPGPIYYVNEHSVTNRERPMTKTTTFNQLRIVICNQRNNIHFCPYFFILSKRLLDYER